MNHIKLWWRWRKRCSDSILTKILVLLKIIKSPTMEWMRWAEEMTEDEFKKIDNMVKMKLNSPITDEQWNLITDAELEHSDEIEFTTPSGKKVVYAKVRHGHWIKGEKIYPDMVNDTTYGYWCSECHHADVHGDNVEVLYCWHCGAKMDSNDSNALNALEMREVNDETK